MLTEHAQRYMLKGLQAGREQLDLRADFEISFSFVPQLPDANF